MVPHTGVRSLYARMDVLALIAAFAKDCPPAAPVKPPPLLPLPLVRAPTLAVLCFSKDRPFQLSQLLLSLPRLGLGSALVVVLYLPGECLSLYAALETRFPRVRFVHERNSFADALDECLDLCADAELLMLCVDDLFVHTETDIRCPLPPFLSPLPMPLLTLA